MRVTVQTAVMRQFAKLRYPVFTLLACSFLLSCTPNVVKKQYLVAEKLWNEQKYSAAAVEFEKVYKEDPKGRIGLQALFRAAMTQTLFLKQHQEAIKNLETYIQGSDDPETVAAAKKEIGEILYGSLGQYPEAILDCFGQRKNDSNQGG